MARRVERIARRVISDNAGVMTDALWAGTFHGIGARLLREYAGPIGLNPAFTVHDREDSATLKHWAAVRAGQRLAVGAQQRFKTH
jgi:DNA helicase II / ATP-dependent DNA helicase PcrA